MKNIIKRFGSTLAIVASMAVVALGTMGAPVLADDCDANGGLGSGMNCAKNDDMPETLTGDNGIVTTVINTMLFIVGILSVVMIIFAGIRYVTAHGDKGQVESAKNTLIYAIVGLIVSIVAYALVNWVVGLFGAGGQ